MPVGTGARKYSQHVQTGLKAVHALALFFHLSRAWSPSQSLDLTSGHVPMLHADSVQKVSFSNILPSCSHKYKLVAYSQKKFLACLSRCLTHVQPSWFYLASAKTFYACEVQTNLNSSRALHLRVFLSSTWTSPCCIITCFDYFYHQFRLSKPQNTFIRASLMKFVNDLMHAIEILWCFYTLDVVIGKNLSNQSRIDSKHEQNMSHELSDNNKSQQRCWIKGYICDPPISHKQIYILYL